MIFSENPFWWGHLLIYKSFKNRQNNGCPWPPSEQIVILWSLLSFVFSFIFWFWILRPLLGHLLIYKSFKNHRQNNGCRPSWPPSEQIAPAVKKCGVGPLLWASKSYTHLSILFVFNVGLLSYYDLWSLLSFVFCFIFCFCFIFWFWILRPFLGHLLIYKSFKNRQNNGCPWPPSEQIVILWSLLSFVFCFIFWFWILHPFLGHLLIYKSFKNRQNNGCPWPPSEQIVILWSLLSFVFLLFFGSEFCATSWGTC